MRRTFRHSLGLVFACVSVAPAALAQTPRDEALRMELISQAESFRASGQHASSLDRAVRAGAIWMTPSLRLFIAREHELLGHVVEAYASARLCVREAEGEPRLPNRSSILERCRDIATVLGPRIGRITVRVTEPPPPGLTVRVRGLAHRAECLNVPCPVQPGVVAVEAEAHGRVAFRREVMVQAGQTTDLSLYLPPVPVPPPVYNLPGPGPGPWIVMGAGVVAVGTAIAFIALRNGADEAQNARCATTECDLQRMAAGDEARQYNTLSAVSFGVGATAIVSGALWWLLHPRGPLRPSPGRAPTVGARLSAQGDWALTLGGTL